MAIPSIHDLEYQTFRNRYLVKSGKDKDEIFYFFLAHNFTFKYISAEDELFFIKHYEIYLNRVFKWTANSFIGVLLIDQVLFRYKFPQARSTSLKSPLTWLKYLGIPFGVYGFTKRFLCDDFYQAKDQVQKKYNLGTFEFQKALDMIDKAYYDGTLDKMFLPEIERPWRYWETPPEKAQTGSNDLNQSTDKDETDKDETAKDETAK